MPKKRNQSEINAWTLDQMAKSTFFHRKLHEWRLVEIADAIAAVRGEELDWDDLNISPQAWNRIIHRGIKPVTVFAHPDVLQTVAGSTAYYRMLSLVSQKSMKRVGIDTDRFEAGVPIADPTRALTIARHLNRIICVLVESDADIDVREFDLWRGMAAGSQAQGSWQNNKGSQAETAIREVVLRRLQENGFVTGEEVDSQAIPLDGERILVFASEPDMAIYAQGRIQVAVEIKGGIDPAGILERVGATLKSLIRARRENSDAITVLILQDVSMTERAAMDLSRNIDIVNHVFSAQTILEDEAERQRFFSVLLI